MSQSSHVTDGAAVVATGLPVWGGLSPFREGDSIFDSPGVAARLAEVAAVARLTGISCAIGCSETANGTVAES
jgi:hypothetical protein